MIDLNSRGFKYVPFSRFTFNRQSLQAAGLVAWWPVKGSSVGTLLDFSGRGFDGVNNGAIFVADVELGEVRNFTKASSQYYQQDRRIVSGFPFTLTAWFRHNTSIITEDSTILGLMVSSVSNKLYGIGVNEGVGGQAFLRARNTISYYVYSGSSGEDDGLVHHLVGVFRSNTDRELYLDGVAVGTDANSVAYDGGVNRWSIGHWGDSSPSDHFDGNIGDVRVYNRGLSVAEIVHQFRNPWDLYKPSPRIFLGEVAGGQPMNLRGTTVPGLRQWHPRY